MSGISLLPAAGIVLAGIMVLAAENVVAQEQPTTPPPAIEPKALAVIKAGCAALSSAQTMSFTATNTYEHAARNGQPLYYAVQSKVTMRRPDKLRVIKIGDGIPDEIYYNGKQVMAYIPSADLVAVADAPPTVDEMLDAAWRFAEMSFPFSDVLVSNPCEIFDKELKTAFYVGQSKVVGGVTTDIIAITTDKVQGEIWVGADDHLIRMTRVNYPDEPAKASYQNEFSDWRINEAADDSVFTTDKAATAKHIAFQAPSAPRDVGDGQKQ